MSSINLKREVSGQVEGIVSRLTTLLSEQGFGVLTRIDFHTKMKEKLGKDLPPVVILGACNPGLAYEALLKNSDAAGLVPCNAVVREIGKNRLSVELTKPSALMAILENKELEGLGREADARLAKVLEGFGSN